MPVRACGAQRRPNCRAIRGKCNEHAQNGVPTPSFCIYIHAAIFIGVGSRGGGQGARAPPTFCSRYRKGGRKGE